MSGPGGGVQSLARAFELLERMADAGHPVTLSRLAAETGLPPATIHRLMRALLDGGYVRQDGSRRYGLGPGLLRLGDAASRMIGSWALPHLRGLVREVGETANIAVLEQDDVVYLAQVPSPHSMRMFTEVGRRVMAHCTGVGKALLAELPEERVQEILRRTGMPSQTERTLTSPQRLAAELARVRRRGYALDDGEQEVGVRCVAVAVRSAPGGSGGSAHLAISVSGPSTRVTDDRVPGIAAAVQRTASELVAELRSA
jgi:IclR family acetate operon transcriptional repressor